MSSLRVDWVLSMISPLTQLSAGHIRWAQYIGVKQAKVSIQMELLIDPCFSSSLVGPSGKTWTQVKLNSKLTRHHTFLADYGWRKIHNYGDWPQFKFRMTNFNLALSVGCQFYYNSLVHSLSFSPRQLFHTLSSLLKYSISPLPSMLRREIP